MDVTFYGVRGSCPCSSEATRRYGGNTACVALTVRGEPPILLDLGTGLRAFAETQPTDGSFRATALVTHIHWDHIQGLPFFPPVDRCGASLDVYAPRHEEGDLATVVGDLIKPPYFPVRVTDLRGSIAFHDVVDTDLAVGNAKVAVRAVPHTGPTVGYRVAWDGAVVTYVSDHQAPVGLEGVADAVLELADDADVLIHDAQYTPEEFDEKSHWGHCTVGFAVDVARQARARTLVLFHHDPGHDDDRMDAILAEARERSGAGGPEVLAAYEGLALRL
ncbi:MAG TPA: MBL fold metallo-hydrolase [Acidimicrobiales bacterium]|nr:MBL fold metallo-hydrolase [Acidimicrobiales bacterium]